MKTLTINIKKIGFGDVETLTIKLPDWCEYITLDGGDMVHAWDRQPQWKNGEFYADPLLTIEHIATLSKKYSIHQPHKAFCDVSKSHGIIIFWEIDWF